MKPALVRQSVRVILSGRLLIEGVDYTIDRKGHIHFVTPRPGETVTVETTMNPERKQRGDIAKWKQRHYGPQRR